jgi:hypothetical protein
MSNMGFMCCSLHIYLNAAVTQSAPIIGKELSTHDTVYQKVASYPLRMAELGLVDYFVMGEAIGIVDTLFVAFYYSRKQMQKLSIDIETKVLSDLDEKMHGLTQMAVEKPQLIRMVINVESDLTEEIAFTYHLLHTPLRMHIICTKEK